MAGASRSLWLLYVVAMGMVTRSCLAWQLSPLSPRRGSLRPQRARLCRPGSGAGTRGSRSVTPTMLFSRAASSSVSAASVASVSPGGGGPLGAASAWGLQKLMEVGPLAANAVALLLKGWAKLPVAIRALISPHDLFLYVTSRLLYAKACRALHACHTFLWRRLGILWEPYSYDESVLGFVEPKLGIVTRLIGIMYLVNVAVAVLVDIGWRIRPDSSKLIGNLLYIVYFANFVNEVKKTYMPIWVPSLQDDKRRSYIIDRASSVVLYVMAILCCIECVSSFLKIPLSSTLAFGGIGGLAFGLASKDVVSNFFGGVMLLFTEPFTPGDMVCFTTRGTSYEGKVERVGWYQTRLRGKDTRPTYVPNSVFVETMVTNMDRITHRRFEANFALRYQDMETLPEVLLEIKKALRALPKVDMLSPFRVHFVTFGTYCLNLQASCYFATKSLDEFLYLQQLALMEITRVVNECGCRLAFPTTHVDIEPRLMGEAIVNGVVDYQSEMQQDVRSSDVVGRPPGPSQGGSLDDEDEEEDEEPGREPAASYAKVRVMPNAADDIPPPPVVPRPPVTPPPNPSSAGYTTGPPPPPQPPGVSVPAGGGGATATVPINRATPVSAVASAAFSVSAMIV